MQNILLNLSVKMEGYFGDWRKEIDESYELSKRLGVGCSLDYDGQYLFKITPEMSKEDIEKLKTRRVCLEALRSGLGRSVGNWPYCRCPKNRRCHDALKMII
jgi:hypothetical protein